MFDVQEVRSQCGSTKVITNSNKKATKYQESEVRWAWGWFRARTGNRKSRCATFLLFYIVTSHRVGALHVNRS